MGRQHRSIEGAPLSNETATIMQLSGEMTNGRKFTAAASLIFVLIFIAGVALRVQDNKTPNPNMTPFDQYLMDRDA
jgi:hypothetical protein